MTCNLWGNCTAHKHTHTMKGGREEGKIKHSWFTALKDIIRLTSVRLVKDC